jgi:hypothetical protein
VKLLLTALLMDSTVLLTDSSSCCSKAAFWKVPREDNQLIVRFQDVLGQEDAGHCVLFVSVTLVNSKRHLTLHSFSRLLNRNFCALSMTSKEGSMGFFWNREWFTIGTLTLSLAGSRMVSDLSKSIGLLWDAQVLHESRSFENDLVD